jgi:hypothetical protein
MKYHRLFTTVGIAVATSLLLPTTRVTAEEKASKVEDRVLIDMNAEEAVDRIIPDTSSMETVSQKLVTYKSASGEAKAIEVTYKPGGQYPTARMLPEGDVWNLSDYNQLALRITNTGESNVRGNLRIDNPGDWKKSPWLNKEFQVAAGATATIKVNLNGYTGSGKKFEKGQLSQIMMFPLGISAPVKLRVEDVRAIAEAAE